MNDYYLDIVSGDIHREIGAYPSLNHIMHTVCEAMHEIMKEKDEILYAPPKGKGATLKVRYYK